MGITGLWDFLRSMCPEVFETIPKESFRGKRIAIDAGQWMFPFRMTARKDVANKCDIVHVGINEDDVDIRWFDRIIGELMGLLKHGITPIIVFDGPSPPAKNDTKKKRNESNEKKQTEINILRSQLKSMDKLRIKQSDIYNLRKLESQIKTRPDGCVDKVRAFLKNLGLPCLIGDNGVEAERLVAALVRTGVAAAGLTKDGDYLVHGGGMLITGDGLSRTDEDDRPIPVFNIIRMSKVLTSLQMTQEMFVEMCILAGCDYNKNIRRFTISKAYRHIITSGRIENIEFTTKQREQIPELKVAVCRELFYPYSFDRLFDVKIFAESFGVTPETITNEIAFNINVDLGCLLEAMSELKIDKYYTDLANLFSNLPTPVNYANMTLHFDGRQVTYTGDPELPDILPLIQTN